MNNGQLTIDKANAKPGTRNAGLEQIEHGIYFGAAGGAIYETKRSETEPEVQNPYTKIKTVPWVKWGSDDNYPQRLIDAFKADPIASLLEKKIAFHWGKGLMFYKKEVDKKGNEKINVVADEEVPQNIHDFLEQNDFNRFMFGIITDFEWWHSFTPHYITNFRGEILQVKWQRRMNVRPEWRNETTGNIDHFYLSNFFGSSTHLTEDTYAKVPAFDRMGKGSGIYNHDLPSVDKDYSPDAAWHGIKQWLNIASKIPRWILANIDNSINIKYHIKIPLEYFLKRCPVEAYKTDAERQKAIQDLEKTTYDNIDKYLAGDKNAMKNFYSKIAVDDQGKAMPGWEIIAIDNKIQDEAWLRAYGTAAMAMVSGIGLSTSLAGYTLPNAMGGGSGSDVREQFNFYMQVMTSIPREMSLEPFKLIKQRNGWPKDLHLGFRDVVLQSVDQNKSGFAKQNEQSPTSDNTEQI